MRKKSLVLLSCLCAMSLAIGITGCSGNQDAASTSEREVQVVENEAETLDYEQDAVAPLEESLQTNLAAVCTEPVVDTRVEGTTLVVDVQLPDYTDESESETLSAAMTNTQTEMENVLSEIEESSKIRLAVAVSVYNETWDRIGYYEF